MSFDPAGGTTLGLLPRSLDCKNLSFRLELDARFAGAGQEGTSGGLFFFREVEAGGAARPRHPVLEEIPERLEGVKEWEFPLPFLDLLVFEDLSLPA